MAYKRLLLAQNVTKPSMYMVPTRPPGRCVGLVFSFVAAFFSLSGTKAEFLPFTAFNLAMSTGSTFLSCHGRVWDEHARFFHHPQKKEWRGCGGFLQVWVYYTLPRRWGGVLDQERLFSQTSNIGQTGNIILLLLDSDSAAGWSEQLLRIVYYIYTIANDLKGDVRFLRFLRFLRFFTVSVRYHSIWS